MVRPWLHDAMVIGPRTRPTTTRSLFARTSGCRSETGLAEPPAESAAARDPADPALHVPLAAVLAAEHLEVARRPGSFVEPRGERRPAGHDVESDTSSRPVAAVAPGVRVRVQTVAAKRSSSPDHPPGESSWPRT